jgi:hypothetical protein
MESNVRIRTFAIALALVLASWSLVAAQAGFDDDRVMPQGFYWESYRHGHLPGHLAAGADCAKWAPALRAFLDRLAR